MRNTINTFPLEKCIPTTDYADKHRFLICENLCNLWCVFLVNRLDINLKT